MKLNFSKNTLANKSDVRDSEFVIKTTFEILMSIKFNLKAMYSWHERYEFEKVLIFSPPWKTIYSQCSVKGYVLKTSKNENSFGIVYYVLVTFLRRVIPLKNFANCSQKHGIPAQHYSPIRVHFTFEKSFPRWRNAREKPPPAPFWIIKEDWNLIQDWIWFALFLFQ